MKSSESLVISQSTCSSPSHVGVSFLTSGRAVLQCHLRGHSLGHSFLKLLALSPLPFCWSFFFTALVATCYDIFYDFIISVPHYSMALWGWAFCLSPSRPFPPPRTFSNTQYMLHNCWMNEYIDNIELLEKPLLISLFFAPAGISRVYLVPLLNWLLSTFSLIYVHFFFFISTSLKVEW